MKFTKEASNGALIIQLKSDHLDARVSRNFKESILKEVEQARLYHVVLDLSDLHFIDSSGLGSFLSILRVLNTKGGDLKLAKLNPSVKSMLEMVRMDKLFEIFITPEQAVKSFGGS